MNTTATPYHAIVGRRPPFTMAELRIRRVELIRQIQEHRGRSLVVFVTNVNIAQPRIPAYINREDLVPLAELLATVKGDAVDILLETPGGLAEVTVEIVSLLRPRFDKVGFIIPHMAMSAGTILTMSGDEILMDHRSSLGAIDPQFPSADGRLQAAQAILQGIETIKQEILKNNGVLNPAYLPILRNVDPGKLQAAINASQLSIDLVTEWLSRFKFRDWQTHSSTGNPVTPQERTDRATQIAKDLCDHKRWLSHSRPIKMADLIGLGIRITDYGEMPDLQLLIWELWVNLHHVLSSTNMYKIYETDTLDVAKVAIAQPPTAVTPPGPGAGKAMVDIKCNKCGSSYKIQCNFGTSHPIEPGAEPFPKDCNFTCKNCGTIMNLTGVKLTIEGQVRQPIVLL